MDFLPKASTGWSAVLCPGEGALLGTWLWELWELWDRGSPSGGRAGQAERRLFLKYLY